MRVLIADKFEQSGRDRLDAAGCEFSYQPDVKDETLVEAIRAYQPDALVVRSTKVTEQMLDAGALKLIVRAGAGYNTIDVAAASRRGVYVSNCPGKNSVAVAELAFALILALDRRIADNVIQLREGRWNKKEFSKARGLLGARSDSSARARSGARSPRARAPSACASSPGVEVSQTSWPPNSASSGARTCGTLRARPMSSASTSP